MGSPARLSLATVGNVRECRLRAVPWQVLAADVVMLERWERLSNTALDPNPFYSPWALLPALRAYDTAGRRSLLLLEHGDRLTGLMPLAAPLSYYGYPAPHFRNWLHASAFLGSPLIAADAGHDFWAHLLACMDAAPASKMFLHLSHLDADSALTAALQDVLKRTGRVSSVVHEEERALLQSDQSPDAYFETALSGKKRKELRRQERRLGEMGTVGFARQTDPGGLDKWIGDFLDLEMAGWKGRADSALACSERTAILFSETLHCAAQAGVLERLTMSLDSRPIAMLANFLTPPGAFAYKTAYDEAFARYSPGVLLQRHNLALLDRNDIDWCDSCAAADHPMIDRIWLERRRMVRLSIAIGGRARRAIFNRMVTHETRGRSAA